MELSKKIASAIERSQIRLAPSKTTRVVDKTRNTALEEASEVVWREERRRGRKDQKRILWVDDRPDNNIFERRAMQSYNIEFVLAESTGEALAKLRKVKFDAIISDMGRPPDSRAGYTLLDALRGSGDLTPFFIYAGSDSPQHLRLALSKGAQGSTNSSDELIMNVLETLEPQG
jgi:CheY-like chemotaxis protein